MRRPLRYLPIVVLSTLSWLLVTGPVATAQDASHLITVQQSGVLRVCTTGDYPPYAPKAYLLPKGDTLFNTVVDTWLESEIRTGRSNQLLTDWIG